MKPFAPTPAQYAEMTRREAADDERQRQTGWPGRTAGLVARSEGSRGEPVRLIALDHPHQAPVDGAGLNRPAYARVDLTHELPIVIHDADGQLMARFAAPADAAFYLTGRLSLPAELLAALDLDADG